jgi:hypothetical protein
MNFQSKASEDLEYARTLVKQAMDGLDSGAADIKLVNAKLNGARTMQNIVKTDMAARLNAPKIHAQEAKMVEARPQVVLTDQSKAA